MQRSAISIGGGFLSVFLTIALLEGGAATIRARETANAPSFVLETPDAGDTADTGADDPAAGDIGLPDPVTQDGQTPVRSVAPESLARPDEVVALPLTRIAPRVPLSEPVARPAPEPAVLRHPVALSAGLIQFETRMLQLDGILPQDPDRTCSTGGTSWPCGTVARTAFRTYLRARALLCDVPKAGWTGTVVSRCTVGGADPSEWLAANGWAEVAAGSRLEDKVAAARAAGLGFFGTDPRGPDPVASPGSDAVIDGDAIGAAAGQ